MMESQLPDDAFASHLLEAAHIEEILAWDYDQRSIVFSDPTDVPEAL